MVINKDKCKYKMFFYNWKIKKKKSLFSPKEVKILGKKYSNFLEKNEHIFHVFSIIKDAKNSKKSVVYVDNVYINMPIIVATLTGLKYKFNSEFIYLV